ncbi:glycosyltransferase, group 2 family protein [Parabacteroides johnsonii DSM 18315]|jgi:hypothetical protein|uniref:Glycosyltransferase, group 2 family protein n=1 Tax=Parabacteroides johnsonii DSM 18315 TaxID=537006 RepID=B7B964_9BACT|nr:glycosyltransferase family A protein [Parabacteroides johnsonii]EEC97032.1 glycosyltransferase, group 2 family protein [Parabacteroides johnsonii DSM 18315]UEA91861.1 glycosyltransferase family 2 protein [Parabacteroides johnsonii]UWP44017.1 glycosyltransferase family 2 protein [Parabacteroides johnsonii DSM 18315]
MLVTIFTPTYNRAYILPDLYKSLCKQTCKDFEWLVVDDGSTDDTKSLFSKWENESDFPIHYVFVPNGGKHRAINYGAKIAEGELFFIVDSDDQLPKDSIFIICKEYNKVRGREDICGVCGLKAYFSGEKVGGEQRFDPFICNSLDFRYKYHIRGDMAEVFRTKVIREFPFPEIPDEKFCPEAVIFQRIASEYKFYYFYRKIYLCDYLLDGLTAKITRIRMQCPVASTICYSELTKSNISVSQKFRASVNYWRFWFCHTTNQKANIGVLWFISFPLGLVMHINDKRKQKI